jgi:hypothetical protein
MNAPDSSEQPGFEIHPLSGESVSVDWRVSRVSDEGDSVTAIGRATTQDACRHWVVTVGRIVAPDGRTLEDLQIRPDAFAGQWLSGGQYGWALLTGNCCGSGQQQTAMVRTQDWGHSWVVIEHGESGEQSLPPDYAEEALEMVTPDQGWFVSAAFGKPRPDLWKLGKSGDVWIDVSESLPIPDGLGQDADVVDVTAPQVIEARPDSVRFTAEFEHLDKDGAAEHFTVGYETADGGTTWRIAAVGRTPVNPMHFVNSARNQGYRVSRDQAGMIAGMQYSMNGFDVQTVKFPMSVDALVTPSGNMDLSVLYAVRSSEVPSGKAIREIFRTTDQGETWTPIDLQAVFSAKR